MNAIYEFFFCPQHGILRPDNWPILLPTLTVWIVAVKAYWNRVTFRLRKEKHG